MVGQGQGLSAIGCAGTCTAAHTFIEHTPNAHSPTAPQPHAPKMVWSIVFLAALQMAEAAARRAATPDLLTAASDQRDWWG